MSKFLLTVCAFGLLLSSASAQGTLTDIELWRRDGLVKKDAPRFVPSGKSRMVGFFTGANADCSVWDLKAMDVQITKAPEHGMVEIVPGESFMTFAKDGIAAHCSGKKYRGTAVNYKSSAGFTGFDEFEVFVMSPNGWATEVRFKMNVRGAYAKASKEYNEPLKALAAIGKPQENAPGHKADTARLASYMCAGFKSVPPENGERDPVVTAEIDVYPERFDIVHATLRGESYNRADQYRDMRFWSSRGSHNWSGVSIKNPRRVMIGKISYDLDDGRPLRYTERVYVTGRLEQTTTSVCTWPD
jgi:hypothetical protein